MENKTADKEEREKITEYSKTDNKVIGSSSVKFLTAW